MPENDFTQECLQSIREEIKEVPHLRDRFCRQCKNGQCQWAELSETLFEKRISTQVDRFLDNPNFADETHPKYFKVREIDFPDLMREAIILEASDIKQDWEVPSIQESVSLVLGKAPSEAMRTRQVDEAVRALAEARGLEPPSVPEPQEDFELEIGKIKDPEERVSQEMLFSILVPSREEIGKSYTVTFNTSGKALRCTCKAGTFNKNCYHLRDAERMIRAGGNPSSSSFPEERRENPKPPPPEFKGESGGKRSSPFPETHKINTPLQKEGIFIGGQGVQVPQIEKDPWEPLTEQIVEVGSTLTVGKK